LREKKGFELCSGLHSEFVECQKQEEILSTLPVLTTSFAECSNPRSGRECYIRWGTGNNAKPMLKYTLSVLVFEDSFALNKSKMFILKVLWDFSPFYTMQP